MVFNFISLKIFVSCFVHCMIQLRLIYDPDNSFEISTLSRHAQSLRCCLLLFLHSLPRDFFGCFANPRTAFGIKRSGVFQPSLVRGYPEKGWLCHKIGHSYRSLMLLSLVTYTVKSWIWFTQIEGQFILEHGL